ncbi:MAG TPA: TIGR00303 family protein [Methanosarcinaceae archaeon]|nr:TIGR00303 family protein [Methanosarcinaceae archaeon]
MGWIVPTPAHVPEKPLFLFVLSNTETAYIPEISAAGKTPELTDYTPAGDAEIVSTGNIASVPVLPITPPYSTPTPAIITRAALNLTGIPHMFINAGLKVVPDVPFVDLMAKPGFDIRKPVAVYDTEGIFKRAQELGSEIGDRTDHLLIGESIPGGTTTAMGVLSALGYNGNVSSSSCSNPLELKNRIVKEGMDVSGVEFGSLRDDPLYAIACLGDPMMVTVAGIVSGINASADGIGVVLAGGTQMAAVFAVIKHLGINTGNISIATTKYVVDDESANFRELVDELGVPVYTADPGFGASNLPGLQRYEAGDVKEGVGAGGAMYLAQMYGVSQEELRLEIEKICIQLCQ